jgi:histidinol phosphatase-like enzyme (inositol monophosphatase family)
MNPSSLSHTQLRRFLSVAKFAAQKGGKHALKYFRKNVQVIKKVDRSPVTRADREAEQIIRGILRKRFPGHQLCGEEFGWDKSASGEFRWWIDPVDGTRQFIRGIAFWGTLVALEYKGEIVLGVIHHPALGLTLWAAKGLGCFANGKKVHVSKIPNLKGGTLTYGGLRLVPKSYRSKLTNLASKSYDDRGFGDCFGHSLVIQGSVEAMVDPVVKPYDVAAIKICVEEAWGKFTSLSGAKTIHGGSSLSSNGLVHQGILRSLK